MIIKFNENYKKSIISDIIKWSISLFSMIFIFIGQLLGVRKFWLLASLATLSEIIVLILIMKVISIHKKVYFALDDKNLAIHNKCINTNEIHSISISDNFISFKIRNNKSIIINLKWVDENDKVTIIQFFNHLTLK